MTIDKRLNTKNHRRNPLTNALCVIFGDIFVAHEDEVLEDFLGFRYFSSLSIPSIIFSIEVASENLR